MSSAETLSEFALIERFFRPLSAESAFLRCGIGDDCAVLAPAVGEELLLSVDTLVESVHFPEHYPAEALARRALAVCVSDLAAAGASPRAFTLTLTAPQLDEVWLAGFSATLAAEAARYGMALAGGDTTRGPLCITLQVMGVAPRGAALLRSGAKLGDRIYVSGTLGDARAALAVLDVNEPDADQQQWLRRYHQPEPRLALGQALRGIASAAIDISDGLAADLGHILRCSGVGATVRLASLPLSAALAGHPSALDYALSGGDDYELCFTAPPQHAAAIAALAETLQLPLSYIGDIAAEPGLRCIDAQGGDYCPAAGYQHF